eukprot:TRINITY_DN5832_c0_g1_i1.p2 TRINITY_DN5832_c0_g1~~TRINITY_DN5832_c0_g1_i1.p2  ORF type:complete len:358 (+),score=78.33 TRINITY_DN5832_c0_g1_i1:71-1075(+)
MQFIPVPRDDDDSRFAQSFDAADPGGAADFFAEYGFAVFRDVLTAAECEATIQEMVGVVRASAPGFVLEDAATHGEWKSRSFGMISASPVFLPQFVRNRQNPHIHRAFATVLGTPDLLVSHDRATIYRPTVSEDGADASHLRTATNVHLDLNPRGFLDNDAAIWRAADALRYGDVRDFISENNLVANDRSAVHVQGVLNLAENLEEDGGLILVPGFHRHFERWVRQELRGQPDKFGVGSNFIFPKHDATNSLAQRIPMRAGSLVIWDQRLAHGSAGNRSTRARCVQFLKMFTKTDIPPARLAARGAAVRRELARSRGALEAVSPLGRVVFGLDS